MGTVIVKAARGQDAYLLWSSVTDGPVFVGTREEVKHALDQPVRGQRWPFEHEVEEWLARADEYGTSAEGVMYWSRSTARSLTWDGEGPAYGQAGRIPRDRLYEYARRILGREGWDPDPGDLLVPFEHPEDPDRTATERT